MLWASADEASEPASVAMGATRKGPSSKGWPGWSSTVSVESGGAPNQCSSRGAMDSAESARRGSVASSPVSTASMGAPVASRPAAGAGDDEEDKNEEDEATGRGA